MPNLWRMRFKLTETWIMITAHAIKYLRANNSFLLSQSVYRLYKVEAKEELVWFYWLRI
jgi:hypothetical protein